MATQGGSVASAACALVTEQDATTAMGSDPGPGHEQATTLACKYGPTPSGSFIGVSTTPVGSNARGAFDHAKSAAQTSYQQQGGTVQDLSGVGDAAFAASTSRGGLCMILKGSVMVQIILASPMPLTSPADVVTTLCSAAGGHL